MLEEKRSDASFIIMLANKHIDRYMQFLLRHRRGEPGYRPEECKHLLNIWRQVLAKRGDYHKLTQEERFEVDDAIEDEEF